MHAKASQHCTVQSVLFVCEDVLRTCQAFHLFNSRLSSFLPFPLPQPCSKTYEQFLQCTAAEDFTAATGVWSDPLTCLTDYQTALTECRATSINFENETADMPATGVVAGLAKTGGIVAYYVVPEVSNKVDKVTCKTCSQLWKKTLQCALPAEVTDPLDLDAALLESFTTCIEEQNDEVLAALCGLDDLFQAFDLTNDGGDITYAFATPNLNIGDLREDCPAVEAEVSNKGTVSAKIMKGRAYLPLP